MNPKKMMIHEVAKLTGITIRTLHYYDEIGLLTPTAKTAAGYRLYDDKALERAMDRLLGDPDLAERLGREAAQIQKKLAPERVNGLWREYFERIMEK